MSIIDEALKKLGSEFPQKEVSSLPKKNAAGTMPDMGFVAGPRKPPRRPDFFFAGDSTCCYRDARLFVVAQ
jgi:hypothetical protein